MGMVIHGWRDREIPVTVRENQTGAGSIIVVPGVGYTPAHPLLHFSAQLFHAAGFTVLELWWHDTLAGWRDVPHEGASQWLGSDVLAAVEAAGRYGPVAGFLTKSLGTIGLSAAATRRPELRERPAVWLTPILTDQQVPLPHSSPAGRPAHLHRAGPAAPPGLAVLDDEPTSALEVRVQARITCSTTLGRSRPTNLFISHDHNVVRQWTTVSW